MRFDPVFKGYRKGSVVAVEVTALDGLLSVSVEDHSSQVTDPKRLWGFLEKEQVAELHAALAVWLADQELSAFS